MRTMLGAVGAALALAGAGCSSTRLATTWSGPEGQVPVHRVLVVAVARDEGFRRAAEADFARQLSARGIEVRSSSELVGGEALTPAAMQALAVRVGADAMLVTEFLGVKDQSWYLPGEGGWYGFYGEPWPARSPKGYYPVYRVAYVSTELLRAGAGGPPIWSTRSQTLNPTSPGQAMTSVSEAVVRQLDRTGLL